eukprot:3947686-Prymnesium_polylepis.2
MNSLNCVARRASCCRVDRCSAGAAPRMACNCASRDVAAPFEGNRSGCPTARLTAVLVPMLLSRSPVDIATCPPRRAVEVTAGRSEF